MQNFEQGPQNAGFGPGYASGSSGYQPFGGQPQTFPNPQNQWYNQGPPRGGYQGGRGGGQNFQPRYVGNRPQFKKQFKKKAPGNVQDNLKKFSAVQQVALLAPDALIEVNPALPDKNCALWKGVATFQGRTVEAFQVGKKKTKQAICSKIIKEFNLLEPVYGPGVSPDQIGMQTDELNHSETQHYMSGGKKAPPTTVETTTNTKAPSPVKKPKKKKNKQNNQQNNVSQANDGMVNFSEPTSFEPIPDPEGDFPMLGDSTPNDPKLKLPVIPVNPIPTARAMGYNPGSNPKPRPNQRKPKDPNVPKGPQPKRTPLLVLSRQYLKNEKPTWEFLPQSGINTGFDVVCILKDGQRFNGIGRGKKQAQHHAAYQALQSVFPQELDGLVLPEGTGTKEHPSQR